MIVELPDVPRIPKRISPDAAQVDGQRHAVGWTLFLVLAVLLTASASANAQSVPEPPTLCDGSGNTCSDDPVTEDPPPSSAGGKKWNPGHYVKAQGQHASANKAEYLDTISSQIVKVEDSPEIKGAQLAYAWGMIESSKGVYDWEPIHRHLDYLSARGRKAIVMIHTKCFGNDCGLLAPADMQSEVYVTPKDRPTLIVELWEEQNMDRFIEFWQAMAAEFDDHPALEMVHGQESTPSLQGTSPENYTKQNYAAQLKRMYAAQGEAFQKTNVTANINWLRGEVSALLEHAYENAVGRAMPDIFDSEGTIIFRGDCDSHGCGVRDYRGLLPHLGVASVQQLDGKFSPLTDTPPETIDYALENKITHISWVSSQSGEDSWENIISEIESTSRDIETACPAAYPNGCQ